MKSGNWRDGKPDARTESGKMKPTDFQHVDYLWDDSSVNRLAPATVVEGSSMFPRDRVISSLAKYGIAFAESESTEALREKLAVFYAQRTLTKSPITLADQAEVAYLLSSNSFSKTTGQIISVDGGLHEAFLR
jgi:hypothetical protein